MIHSVPELKVSQSLAKKLGRADTDRLLSDRKLVLLVDLDQTLIHTTNDNVPNNLKVTSDSPFWVINLIVAFYCRMFIIFNCTAQILLGTTQDFALER
jgi:TFIIF-interacting CTD phosphatase-like protein